MSQINHAYYKSKWTFDDLNGKTVQYSMLRNAGRFFGIGKFRIHTHADLIAITVYQELPDRQEDVLRIWNPDLQAKIERHPDPSVADFLLGE